MTMNGDDGGYFLQMMPTDDDGIWKNMKVQGEIDMVDDIECQMMMCDDRAGSLVTGTRATLQLSQHERNASTQRDAVGLADFLGRHVESSRRDERSARHRRAHASQK